ncbi:hypothetical protein BC834DRAFT_558783 [Gloeopeniophorella convolvens]|nr:hypothetical protein BC834DRAFT_558783 [Gloeopeniophorella convolvens]
MTRPCARTHAAVPLSTVLYLRTDLWHLLVNAIRRPHPSTRHSIARAQEPRPSRVQYAQRGESDCAPHGGGTSLAARFWRFAPSRRAARGPQNPPSQAPIGPRRTPPARRSQSTAAPVIGGVSAGRGRQRRACPFPPRVRVSVRSSAGVHQKGARARARARKHGHAPRCGFGAHQQRLSRFPAGGAP